MPITENKTPETARVTPAAPGLLNLPPGVKELVLKFLGPEDTSAIGRINHDLREVANTNTLWEEKLTRHFPEAAYRLEKQLSYLSKAFNSDDNGASEAEKIDYRTEFIKAYQEDYQQLSVAEKYRFSEVKEGRNPFLREPESNSISADGAIQLLNKFLRTKDHKNLTPIHWAVRLRHQHLLDDWYKCITQNIEEGNLGIEMHGINLLEEKARFNQKEIINEITEENDFSRALSIAAEYGCIDIVKGVRKRNILTNPMDYEAALFSAAYSGCADVVRELLTYIDDEGNRICNINAFNNFGNTALHIAAVMGYIDVVTELLTYNDEEGNPICDINATNNESYTALESAAARGHANVVTELLILKNKLNGHTFNIDVDSHCRNARDLAMRNGRSDVYAILYWYHVAKEFQTPLQQALAVFRAVNKSLYVTVDNISRFFSFGKKPKNIFCEIYDKLSSLSTSSEEVSVAEIKTTIDDIVGAAQINASDRAFLENVQAFLDTFIFDSAAKAEQAIPASDDINKLYKQGCYIC